MDDLAHFCCLNSQCPDAGRRGAGNLTVTGRLGKSRQFRLLYCRTCRDRFSERKGTPLYRLMCKITDRFFAPSQTQRCFRDLIASAERHAASYTN